MSTPTRTLLIGATLAAMHLAGMTAVAHAQAVDQPLAGAALTRRPGSAPAPTTARSPPATARSATSQTNGRPTKVETTQHRPEPEGAAMKVHPRRILAAIAVVGALISTALIVVPARATPPSGVMSSTIGIGRFTEIDAKTKTDIDPGTPTQFWTGRIKANRPSDLYVLQNTIAPGGSFGWHSHPGPSLVIVKAGTASFYLASDPTCTVHVVPTGSGFVDQGHDVHVVRNQGSVDLVMVVVSLVPAGFERRIDEPNPGNCPFPA